MKKRLHRLERINAVAREFGVARLALERLELTVRTDPELLRKARWTPADVANAKDRLETTYLLRLFAEFEAGLRDAWENAFKQTTTPPMKDLLTGVAARRSIPDTDLDNAHTVRVYRNSLVHEGGEEAVEVLFGEAKSILCTFFSWLPLDW